MPIETLRDALLAIKWAHRALRQFDLPAAERALRGLLRCGLPEGLTPAEFRVLCRALADVLEALDEASRVAVCERLREESVRLRQWQDGERQRVVPDSDFHAGELLALLLVLLHYSRALPDDLLYLLQPWAQILPPPSVGGWG